MKLKYSFIFVIMTSIFLLCSISYASSSANILYAETDLGGSWRYDYSFYNTSDAGESLNSVWFDFAQIATVEWLAIPSGWDSTFWGFPPIPTDYLDTNSTDTSYDIIAGNSLSGFSFTIDYHAGNIPFTAYFNGDNVISGTTSTSVVPEPASAALFIIGATTLGLRRYFKCKPV